MISSYVKNLAILFFIFIILSLIIISYSENKKITSIYAREGFTSEMKVQRIAGVLHSGDLIDIADSNTSDMKFMNRQDYNSEIIFTKPEDTTVTTNLSKLRIMSVNHEDRSMQLPIKYGDTIYIAHNAYIENKNVVRFIKYGEKLQSHQTGEMFRNYVILNPSDSKDTSFVKYDSPVIFRKADTASDSFLTIDSTNGSITAKNPQDKASKFYIKLRRDFEPYDRHLCICTDEILYP